jgi:ferredoxin
MSLSRRELFTGLFGRRPEPPPAPPVQAPLHAKAFLRAAACLAWQGSFCTVCSERCPVPGAITLDAAARPVIDPARCTGCAVCKAVCPAPNTALLVLVPRGAPT